MVTMRLTSRPRSRFCSRSSLVKALCFLAVLTILALKTKRIVMSSFNFNFTLSRVGLYTNSKTTNRAQRGAFALFSNRKSLGMLGSNLVQRRSDSRLQWEMEIRRNRDLMNLDPFPFLPNYKNPCWWESTVPTFRCPISRSQDNMLYTARKHGQVILRCLPYFFLIGQPKCATTDIYTRLTNHPDVATTIVKESFWLDKIRLQSANCSSIDDYVDFFQGASRIIHNHSIESPGNVSYYYIVTGDGTPDYMWDNHAWHLLPGNEGCREPCVTNADMVHHLVPHARIIVSFRNPVERIYSDYVYESIYLKYNPSPEDFHKEVIKEIDEFTDCIETSTLRSCVYNGSHEDALTTKARLRQGLYSVHLSDWLRVFAREQIHIIRFEDYIQDVKTEMTKLFDFLDLRSISEKSLLKIAATKPQNKKNISLTISGDMLPRTREILTLFYQPFNVKLAYMLDDERFLWDQIKRP